MEDIIDIAFRYMQSYDTVGRAHYIAWEKIAARNRWIGIPVVATTTIVGTAIFGSLQTEDLALEWKILTGLLSILAAVLSSLQTFFKYPELAERHKKAGAEYAAMRRRLDIFILKYRHNSERDRQSALKDFEEIATRFGELAEESPSIPDKWYDQSKREMLKKRTE